jgi:hypothetical protein
MHLESSAVDRDARTGVPASFRAWSIRAWSIEPFLPGPLELCAQRVVYRAGSKTVFTSSVDAEKLARFKRQRPLRWGYRQEMRRTVQTSRRALRASTGCQLRWTS